MAGYVDVGPEIMGHAEQIVKNTIGTKTKLKGFEWSDGGGLFTKVFKLDTTDGCYILKIERDKIFFATRKDQIENEVLGNQIFQKAGISCANILAYDLTKNDIGAKYVFTEHINNDMEDWPLWGKTEDLDDATKTEITRQFTEAMLKMRAMTNTHFGSLSQFGALGWHETYDGYYRSTLNLLIEDSEHCGVFTNEELDIVKEAAEKPLAYSKKYIPTFVHGDFGYHNTIWGNIGGGENRVYVYDFGNAYYGLPYLEEMINKIHGKDVDMVADMDLDRHLYENSLIYDFEKMFWAVTERLTEDYTYGRDWMIAHIEAAKKDTSRTHITDFVDSCRKVLNGLEGGRGHSI